MVQTIKQDISVVASPFMISTEETFKNTGASLLFTIVII